MNEILIVGDGGYGTTAFFKVSGDNLSGYRVECSMGNAEFVHDHFLTDIIEACQAKLFVTQEVVS